jgi:hypothetical protein
MKNIHLGKELLERIETLYELGVQRHLVDVPDDLLRRYARRLVRSLALRDQGCQSGDGDACALDCEPAWLKFPEHPAPTWPPRTVLAARIDEEVSLGVSSFLVHRALGFRLGSHP